MVLKVQARGGFTSDFIISQETLTMRAHRGGGGCACSWMCGRRARERERERERETATARAGFQERGLDRPPCPREREREFPSMTLLSVRYGGSTSYCSLAVVDGTGGMNTCRT